MNDDVTYIKEIISSVKPLPALKQHIGKSEVEWWEGRPGDAVIMAVGGTVADRILAEQVVAAQLEGFGYKRATFTFEKEAGPWDAIKGVGNKLKGLLPGQKQEKPEERFPEKRETGPDPTDILDREREQSDTGFAEDDNNLNAEQHERTIDRQDNWNNLVEKAKRIVNTGGVTIINSEDDFVVGTVRGDHGTYQCEISRQDPDAPVITGWHCTCPWNQYAWQRTRQWKVYEGRPCSHILALYYVDKQLSTMKEKEFVSTPPDLEGPPKAPPAPVGEPSLFGAPGGDQMPGGVVPSVPEGPRGLRQLTPFKAPDVQEQLEQRLGPAAPPRTPEPDEPEEARPELQMQESPLSLPPRQKIQTPPLEQLKEQQRLEQPPSAPGAAPYGQAAPPGTVSVPGARQPNERNPFGSIWSNTRNGHRVAAVPGWFKYKNGDAITLAESAFGIAEGPSNAQGVGEYQEIPAGSVGEVHGQDERMGWVDAIFPLSGGPKTPYHVRCFLDPKEIVPPTTPEAKEERRGPDTKLRPFGS